MGIRGMRLRSLSAAVGATVVASGLVAGGAAAAPPDTYDQEAVKTFDAANSVRHIRHLAVGIGPRLNGTPQEREAAEYLAGVLQTYGFETRLQSWGPVSTKNVAKVASSSAELPGGPNWQMSASANARFTGDESVQGEVVYAGTGQTPESFPADTAGKIVLMDHSATAATRNAAVVNAVARGAIAVILASRSTNAAPPSGGNMTLTTPQPDVPVVGGGTAHGDWIRGLLAQGPLTLRIATNSYVTPMGTNVIATRRAVNDADGDSAPIVMVGAHIDSVLGAPGAHDDASGNGVSLEFARVVSRLPLDKEVRIGGFGGEESGLLGARAYVATLPPAERARFVGEWQMDMVGTPHEPARLWALTPNGVSNFVVQSAYDAAGRIGFDGLRNCRLGQSDHQAFFDAGIPSSLFIWLDYRPPPVCGPTGGTYVTEPQYHRPTDTMANISQERLQTTLNVVGAAAFHHALNQVTVSTRDGAAAPLQGAAVTADCGDGWRSFGQTGSSGTLTAAIPHATCDFKVVSGGATAMADNVEIFGDRTIPFAFATGEVGGTVPATLALSLGPAASLGAFAPGVAREYTTSLTANVISTAGDAQLSVQDPSATATGRLVNGAFALADPLQARATNASNPSAAFAPLKGDGSPLALLSYAGPVSNDAVTVGIKQSIGANQPLRTGRYAKTLTFTLSTTTP